MALISPVCGGNSLSYSRHSITGKQFPLPKLILNVVPYYPQYPCFLMIALCLLYTLSNTSRIVGETTQYPVINEQVPPHVYIPPPYRTSLLITTIRSTPEETIPATPTGPGSQNIRAGKRKPPLLVRMILWISFRLIQIKLPVNRKLRASHQIHRPNHIGLQN